MKVKDICTLQNGRAFKPEDWGLEGLPIVRIQNLNDENAPFNYYSGEYSQIHEINNGDLLFSWSGTPGTSFGAFRWYRGKGVLNQHIFKVLPKIDVDLDYLKYAFNGNIDSIIAKAHGGVGLQHITKKELDEIEVPILPKEKQISVVGILQHAETIIFKRKLQLSSLDDLIKARFVEMFGDPFSNPLNWECISFKESSLRLSDGPFGSNLKSEHYSE
ncbi:MAG: restriction endonuclease subunit S, partial [Aeriscardovia sp.]|nr:restriction endonuclease subunit S [Aeriscardovia sp.]